MTDQIVIQPDPQLLVIEQTAETVSIVINTGQEGPQGPAGPAGDGSKLTKIAGSAIGGHKVVIASGVSGAQLADKDTPAHMHLVLGVTQGAASSGSPVDIQTVGEMIEPSWSWSAGPVFLGSNGNLTQTPPASGFQLLIGTAIAPTVLMIKIGAPISLS